MAALWGGHSLRPSRFSLSINFSCHSCTNSHSLGACAPSSSSEGTSSRGTNIADMTFATCAPFLRKMALSIMFRTTIETCLLPAVSMVYACSTCSLEGSECAFLCTTSASLIGATITWVSCAGAYSTLPFKIST